MVSSLLTTAQSDKIYFSDISLKTALAVAKEKNKNVFIDSYASYCKPCKVMEQEFRNPDVARFYNKHFVNVRINMETEKAKEYELEYQIVFLPTMIYVTPEGRVLTKLDRIVPADELLSIGKLFGNQPNSAPAVVAQAAPPKKEVIKTAPITSKPAQVQTTVVPPATPAPKKTKPAIAESQPAEIKTNPADIIVDESEGKILYVMGQDDANLPPEILREEAYFRMGLMDGSHQKAAKKYLATQSDWSEEGNVKFIHDFVDDARSKEFEYIVANKALFEEVVGSESIKQTINILVNKELERAYPRPDLERATSLYTLAERPDPIQKAQIYHLNNLYESENKKGFMTLASTLDIATLQDAKVIHRYITQKTNSNPSKKELKVLLALAENATALSPDTAVYHYSKANIALRLKNKQLALDAVNTALTLADNSDDKKKISKLLEQIKLQ